jgi:hypothetical protein
MPTTRPSDKGEDKAQWWKEESPEQIEGEEKVGPSAYNKQKAGKNKFDEEMETVKHPV